MSQNPYNSSPSAAVDLVLARLEGVRQVKLDSWMALCPAHDDNNPSLSINPGDDGKALLKCFAGCSIENITQAIGLSLADLMPRSERSGWNHGSTQNGRGSKTGPAPRQPQENKQLVAEYRYEDETGELLAIKRRYSTAFGKKFDWFSPDGRGGLRSGRQGRPTLYKLPAVIAAGKAGGRVYVVEGEKDVDALTDLNLVATTNPDGGGNWKGDRFAAYLHNAHVVIIPDNDDTGEKHQAAVGASLQGVAASVRLLRLPDLPPGGDVSDWLSSGGTAEGLERLADNAPAWMPNVSKDAPEDLVWEDPVPFGSVTLPNFPVECLPRWLAEFVNASAEDIGVPTDFIGVQVLAALATALQKKGRIFGKEGYSEPLNLWCVSVMEPGSRKSAGLSRVIAPIKQHEGREMKDAAPQIEQDQSRERILKQSLADAEKKVASGGDKADQSEVDRCLEELAELQASAARPVRLCADDATPEALQMLLSHHGGKISVLSAEGGTFQHMAGKYSEKGGGNIDVYLQSHSGDDIIADRVRDQRHFQIKSPALTLGLAVQPIVIRGLQKNAEFRGKGVLARILFSYPPDNVGYIPFDTLATPANILAAYENGLRVLLSLKPTQDKSGTALPYEMHLAPAAREAFTHFYNSVQERQRPGAAFYPLRDWASKLHGACLRIAGLLHMADQFSEGWLGNLAAKWDEAPSEQWVEIVGGGWNQPVSKRTVQAAIEISEYFATHALHAFGEMGADKQQDDAREVLEWLKRRDGKNGASISEADCWRNLRNGSKQKEDLVAALKVLADRGYLKQCPEQTRSGPGRPQTNRYAVHPDLLRPVVEARDEPEHPSLERPTKLNQLNQFGDEAVTNGNSAINSISWDVLGGHGAGQGSEAASLEDDDFAEVEI